MQTDDVALTIAIAKPDSQELKDSLFDILKAGVVVVEDFFSQGNFLHFFSGVEPGDVEQGFDVLEGDGGLSSPSHSLHFFADFFPDVVGKVLLPDSPRFLPFRCFSPFPSRS